MLPSQAQIRFQFWKIPAALEIIPHAKFVSVGDVIAIDRPMSSDTCKL